MQDFKSNLLSIAVILIVTGVIGRLAPENSNKSVIRFIITTVIFASVFSIDYDIDTFSENFNFTTETYRQEIIESEINDVIYVKLCEEINMKTDETVKKYSASAKTSVLFEDNLMVINVYHNGDISADVKQRIEREIQNNFEGEIIFNYTVVTE